MAEFFPDVARPIPFGGLDSSDPLAYKVYQPDRLILGKRMEDHLRIGVCLWHSFSWPGTDVFGQGTFDRPWLEPGLEPMAAARERLDAAFEFLAKLGVPFFCFHDRDVSPEGRTFAETQANLDEVVATIAARRIVEHLQGARFRVMKRPLAERAARRELAAPLSTAEPEDVVKAIAFGLRFESGRRVWQADEYMAVITAKRLIEHLALDGFVVLKLPPLGGHSALGQGFEG